MKIPENGHDILVSRNGPGVLGFVVKSIVEGSRSDVGNRNLAPQSRSCEAKGQGDVVEGSTRDRKAPVTAVART